jgi:hypothetical protein
MDLILFLYALATLAVFLWAGIAKWLEDSNKPHLNLILCGGLIAALYLLLR